MYPCRDHDGRSYSPSRLPRVERPDRSGASWRIRRRTAARQAAQRSSISSSWRRCGNWPVVFSSWPPALCPPRARSSRSFGPIGRIIRPTSGPRCRQPSSASSPATSSPLRRVCCSSFHPGTEAFPRPQHHDIFSAADRHRPGPGADAFGYGAQSRSCGARLLFRDHDCHGGRPHPIGRAQHRCREGVWRRLLAGVAAGPAPERATLDTWRVANCRAECRARLDPCRFGGGGRWGLGVYLLGSLGRADPARLWGIGLVATSIAGLAYGLFALLGRRVAGASRAVTVPASASRVLPTAGADRLSRASIVIVSAALPLLIWWALLDLLDVPDLIAKTPAGVIEYLFLLTVLQPRKSGWRKLVANISHHRRRTARRAFVRFCACGGQRDFPPLPGR